MSQYLTYLLEGHKGWGKEDDIEEEEFDLQPKVHKPNQENVGMIHSPQPTPPEIKSSH